MLLIRLHNNAAPPPHVRTGLIVFLSYNFIVSLQKMMLDVMNSELYCGTVSDRLTFTY